MLRNSVRTHLSKNPRRKEAGYGLATAIGGRRPWKEVRRALAMSTEHEIGKREFRRLRKTIPKPGQLLTETRRRCSGGLVAARILAANLAKFDAAAAARDELGIAGGGASI